MKASSTLFAAIIGVILFASCEKLPGEGGQASVTGRVWIDQYNKIGEIEASYAAPDERVYIIYGENELYDDEMRTHYDGRFAFDYLKAGTYTVFCYSDCDTCESGVEALTKTITLESNKDIQDIGDLKIVKY